MLESKKVLGTETTMGVIIIWEYRGEGRINKRGAMDSKVQLDSSKFS